MPYSQPSWRITTELPPREEGVMIPVGRSESKQMGVDPPILDYRDGSPESLTDAPWLALLLCAPGAACFIIYFGNVGDFGLFWGMLLMAVITAIASLILYGRNPRRALRWYVLLNLAINVTGLLFALLGLVAIL